MDKQFHRKLYVGYDYVFKLGYGLFKILNEDACTNVSIEGVYE